MPKVKNADRENIEAFRKIVKKNMAEQGIEYQKDLARKIYLRPETFSRYMKNPKDMKYKTLRRMVQILKLSKEEKELLLD